MSSSRLALPAPRHSVCIRRMTRCSGEQPLSVVAIQPGGVCSKRLLHDYHRFGAFRIIFAQGTAGGVGGCERICHNINASEVLTCPNCVTQSVHRLTMMGPVSFAMHPSGLRWPNRANQSESLCSPHGLGRVVLKSRTHIHGVLVRVPWFCRHECCVRLE